MRQWWWTMLLGISLTSCAGTAGGPLRQIADHPGHPDAAAAYLDRPSSVLALELDAPEQPNENGAPDLDMHQHETQTDGAESPSPAPYICPMHPEVGSEDVAARCPKCGMKLVSREEVEEP